MIEAQIVETGQRNKKPDQSESLSLQRNESTTPLFPSFKEIDEFTIASAQIQSSGLWEKNQRKYWQKRYPLEERKIRRMPGIRE